MLNQPAPNFTLPDQYGVVRSLKDYAGKWVVVYFYPRDNSLNCVRESCSFRDVYQIISQFGGAEIIGINHGSVASHKKFAENNNLNFPILSDAKHIVTKAFGAWRSNKPAFVDTFFGTRRNTYIINPEGIVVKVYLTVEPRNHAQQIIDDLHAFKAVPNIA